MKISLPTGTVDNDYESFDWFINLSNLGLESENIEIDASNTSFFYGNLCSVFCAIGDNIKDTCKLTLRNLDTRIMELFQKNKAGQRFGLSTKDDINNTTIEYRSFSKGESVEFIKYYLSCFKHECLPSMTNIVRIMLNKSLCEVFVNADTHSETRKIYSCGQFFPHKNLLTFSITDLGIGFQGSYYNFKKQNVSSIEAIEWALRGNTTKTSTGGLGLQSIKDFIEKNNGALIIVSKDAYWELKSNNVYTRVFANPFPGTVVTLEIKTDDDKFYCLKDEIE